MNTGQTIVGEGRRPRLITKLVAGYCVLVTMFFVAQMVISGVTLRHDLRLDAATFLLILLIGLLIPLAWRWFPRRLPVLLAIWWLPQVIAVTRNHYLSDGREVVTPIWHVALLLSGGPNVGLQDGPSTTYEISINLLAVVALGLILLTGRRANLFKRESLEPRAGS
jgi:energy-coupling factor transporter transmembrane protein EcfT